MLNDKECPLCGEKATTTHVEAETIGGELRYCDPPREVVNCDRCGDYAIESNLALNIQAGRKPRGEIDLLLPDGEGGEKKVKVKLHLLSGRTKTYWVQTDKRLPLTRECLLEQLGSAQVPKNPAQCADKLLLYVKLNSSRYGSVVALERKKDWPVAYAHDAEEFVHFSKHLAEARMIRDVGGTRNSEGRKVVLTMEGWKRTEELATAGPDSNQAFVAMASERDMEEVCWPVVRLALQDTGYDPLCVNWQEDNEKIDDYITAEIRRSALVIVDCTHHKQNVYYEAGFAHGLGRTVIPMCREDEFTAEKRQFDLMTYRHIVWDDANDLYAKLCNRIRGMGLDRKGGETVKPTKKRPGKT